MYRTDFWTLWEKARVGCFRRTASKHVYYLGWNRSPAQVGWMRQVLGPGALGRPRGIGRKGRWEGGSGWGIHVKPWLILVNVWQNPLQYCKLISLQLMKKNICVCVHIHIYTLYTHTYQDDIMFCVHVLSIVIESLIPTHWDILLCFEG